MMKPACSCKVGGRKHLERNALGNLSLHFSLKQNKLPVISLDQGCAICNAFAQKQCDDSSDRQIIKNIMHIMHTHLDIIQSIYMMYNVCNIIIIYIT